MASTDSIPIPRKNVAFRAIFDLRLNTGALNSGAAGLDSECSKDQGTMTDCTNEATEIATSSGHYYLDLTSTEMNVDSVCVQIKSSTTNAVTRTLLIYPQESGDIKVDVQSLLGTAWLTPGTAGTPDVNVKLWNALATVALPLVPTTAGRTLDVSTGGEAGVDWANVGSPTTTLALSATTIAPTQKCDIDTIKTNPVVNIGTVTFPTNSTLASTGNITGGTITTVTNLTNAPTAGDLTATMKSSVTIAATASTPTINATQAFSNTGTWTGNIVGTLSTLTTYTGNTPQTGDAYAVVNSGTFGNAAIKGYVDDIGVAGAGLTAIQLPSNGLANVTAWTVALTGNVTGNLSGSVGSVTGAVGSVTGAVGSVTGAVGSVTGAVGSVTGNVGGSVASVTAVVSADVTKWKGTTAATVDTAGYPVVTIKDGTGSGELNTSGGKISGIAGIIDTFDSLNDALSSFHGSGSWEDAGGGGGGGAGSGAYAITVTVNDGATVLQNVNVRVTEGINTFTNLTDASGHADFSLDAATYVLTLTKSGYTYTPTSKTVTGNHTGTLNATHSMTLFTAPTASGTQTVAWIYTYDGNGALKAGVVISFRVLNPPGTASYNTGVITGTSDAGGLLTVNLPQNAACEASRGDGAWVTFTTDSDSSTALPEILGTDY